MLKRLSDYWKKSIIHVETEDVTFDDEGVNSSENISGTEDTQNLANEVPVEASTGEVHPGEYDEMDTNKQLSENKSGEQSQKLDTNDITEVPKKKPKKKTQITFERYEAISNAIATYLRSKETEAGMSTEKSKIPYLTWGETVKWYLEHCEKQIGDSVDELRDLRKLTNLVIRRLISVDHVLIYITEESAAENIEEEDRKIAVHPNYVVW